MIHYSPHMRFASGKRSPDGWSNEEWHRGAIADTGTSHMKAARVALVQCGWCDEAFVAPTVAEAMGMFRDHEDRMINPPLPPEVKP